MNTPQARTRATPAGGTMLDTLVEFLDDRVADRVADRVIEHLNATQQPQAPSGRLLSLDELVRLLPATKKPQTWRRWLYDQLRGNQVPGACKLGGSWFFRPDTTLEWLNLNGDEQ